MEKIVRIKRVQFEFKLFEKGWREISAGLCYDTTAAEPGAPTDNGVTLTGIKLVKGFISLYRFCIRVVYYIKG
jgi:hypothetical protein